MTAAIAAGSTPLLSGVVLNGTQSTLVATAD
jgi:hypothetical protein